VPVKWQSGVARARLCAGKRGGKDGIGAETTLVACGIQRDHRVVECALIGNLSPKQRVSDFAVYMCDRLAHAFPEIAIAVAIAQLDRLPRAGRGAGGNRCPSYGPGVESYFGVNGRITARVQYLTRMHVDDFSQRCHPRFSCMLLDAFPWQSVPRATD
jgi:hypothetical protein